jgi:uncharacterized protein (TIGR03086 family)
MPTIDHRAYDRIAVEASVALVDRVGPADLARPTPCAGWSVADLLAHMAAQHRGFAAAARGDGADLSHWRELPLGDAVAEPYRAAATDVLDSFAGVTALDQRLVLGDLFGGADVPTYRAIGFHLIDYVVHSWDVARALDTTVSFSDDLLAAALPIAQAVPDRENRRVPRASFAPGLPVAADAPVLDQILALLGRSPTWSAP